MQPGEVVKALISHSGMSAEAMSAACGRSPSWARVVSQPSRSPALATVAQVADAAGVDVVLRDRATGEDVATIEPPEPR